MPRLALPPAVITQDSESLHQHRRLAILRRVLNDDSLLLRARVAAALVLLYTQPAARTPSPRSNRCPRAPSWASARPCPRATSRPSLPCTGNDELPGHSRQAAARHLLASMYAPRGRHIEGRPHRGSARIFRGAGAGTSAAGGSPAGRWWSWRASSGSGGQAPMGLRAELAFPSARRGTTGIHIRTGALIDV